MKWHEDSLDLLQDLVLAFDRNLRACLHKLAKSVERHTRSGGRQGYPQFIDRFLE